MPRMEDLLAEGQGLIEVGGVIVARDLATQAELDSATTGVLGAPKAGRWHSHPVIGPQGQSQAIGFHRAVPFWLPQSTTFDRIAVDLIVAGATGAVVRLGIYNDAASFPSSLVLDAGTVLVDSGSGTREITINQTLNAGMYWLTACTQVADSNLRSFGNVGATTVHRPASTTTKLSDGSSVGVVANTSGITAGLPATFGAAAEVSGNSLVIVMLRAV